LTDLVDHEVIGYSHVSNAQLWKIGNNIPPTLHGRITLNNGEAIRDMAIEGLGLAILPSFIANPAIEKGQLEHIPLETESRKMPIVAVWPPVSPMPPKLRRFIDHLLRELDGGVLWQSKADARP
jgi:DNA-binding transcriptional LysR family regulator